MGIRSQNSLTKRTVDAAHPTDLTLEEVGRLARAFDELETEGTNLKALNIARLWALTGCRDSAGSSGLAGTPVCANAIHASLIISASF